jgi:hypothetical protein
MKLRRVFFAIRTVRSDSGGIVENGPFCVRLRSLKVIHMEGEHQLTIPLEPSYCQIGEAGIRHWDGSSKPFQEYEVSKIKYNIHAVLDHMHEKYER